MPKYLSTDPHAGEPIYSQFADVEGGSSVNAPPPASIASMQLAGGGQTALDPETGRPDAAVPPGMAPGVGAAVNRGGDAALVTAATALPILTAPRRVVGGFIGGQEGLRRGGVPGMLGGAALGAIAPGVTTTGSAVADVADLAGQHGTAAGVATLTAGYLLKKYGAGTLAKILKGKFGPQILAEGLETVAPGMAKGANPELLANIEKAILEGGASPATAKAVAAAEVAKGAASGAEAVSPALPGVANAVQTTVASKGPAQAIISFAKDVAKRNPKVGEKIWMELGPDGLPLRYLTPDQAGAAARAGKTTTWAKNLWQ